MALKWLAPAAMLLVGVSLGAGCGDDDSDGEGATTATTPPTAASTVSSTAAPAARADCATTPADTSRTVRIGVDDEQAGFGGISSRTPSGLTAGPVRLLVAADEENAGPVTVTVTSGPTSYEIAGVPADTECGIDVDLAPGTYRATSDRTGGDVEFTVVP